MSQIIPPLKQKTGIVKSKVPPPVPPRGSPRVDRRTSTGSQKSAQLHGFSPRNMSPGTRNYLNDKYFDTVQPNTNNMCRLTPLKLYNMTRRRASAPQPIFGMRRSPTCVYDWLAINDFAASDFDEHVLLNANGIGHFRGGSVDAINVSSFVDQTSLEKTKWSATLLPASQPPPLAPPRLSRPVLIKTAHLQKQASFRNSGSGSDVSVRSMVEKYSKKSSKKIANDAKLLAKHRTSIDSDDNCIRKNFVSDRVRAYDFDVANPAHQPVPTIHVSSTEPTQAILTKLKRKSRRTAPRHPGDECYLENYVKKSEILKTHSNVQKPEGLHDEFSLDGEFV